MGIDIVGWRSCPLQEALGEEDFLGKLKLRAYKRLLEETVPAEKLAETKLRVVVGEQERTLQYAQLSVEVAAFSRGIDECATCPLSGGTPVGCYRYVTYPIEAAFEEVLFSFFCEQLTVDGSSSAELFDEAVEPELGKETPFHDRGENDLAEGTPFQATFDFEDGSEKLVDSAHLLTAVFGLGDEPPPQQVLSAFLTDFLDWVDERAAEGTVETRVTPESDGLEMTVHVREGGGAEEFSLRLALANALRGKTLTEVREWSDMLKAIVEHDGDGWCQIVHG